MASKTTISGQLSAYQGNPIEMAFRWQADNGPHRMLAFYVPSKIFQLNRDGSSWVEPVLS